MTSTPKALNQQRARRRANLAAGLTFDGRPRRNYRWPELDGLPRRERMNERIRIAKLRGTRAVKNGGLGFVLEKRPKNHAAWKLENKILRAQIDQAAAAIAEIYLELPAKAQAACQRLANNLGGIRKGLQ